MFGSRFHRAPSPEGGSSPPAAPEPRVADLATRAAQGDLAATQALVEEVGRSVVWAVRSVLGPSAADADDIVQQSLIAFVQSLPRFRNECAPKTYAIRIAVRAALAGRKQNESRRARIEGLAQSDSAPPSIRTPAEQVHAARRRDLVRKLLDELPNEQAEALALHIVLDLPLKEVADATGAPVNTVKSRLRLAKQALRDRIVADATLAEELGVTG